MSRERGATKLLPCKLHSVSQHQDLFELLCFCELLCLIWIYFVHLLATCVLWQLLLYAIWLTKGFIETLYFVIVEKTRMKKV